MTAASVDNQKPWSVTALDHPVGLEIHLLQNAFVLPWNQFLYAEGRSEEVRLAFSTHDVVVKGSHLESLIADLSAQRVSQLREPFRAERFPFGTHPQIASISVQKVE